MRNSTSSNKVWVRAVRIHWNDSDSNWSTGENAKPTATGRRVLSSLLANCMFVYKIRGSLAGGISLSQRNLAACFNFRLVCLCSPDWLIPNSVKTRYSCASFHASRCSVSVPQTTVVLAWYLTVSWLGHVLGCLNSVAWSQWPEPCSDYSRICTDYQWQQGSPWVGVN